MEKLSFILSKLIGDNLNNLMNAWEKERGTFSIWHNGPIDDDMVEAINNIVQTKLKSGEKPKKIDLIVNSGGGYIESAYQIVCLLDRNFKESEIEFFVPRVAKSAATLIACGCNKILFSQIGELGPLDVQIGRGPNKRAISGITINRLVEEELKGENSNDNMKEWIYRTLTPEEVLELKRFNEVAVEYLKELLPKRMFKGKKPEDKEIKKVIKKLCQEFPNHSFVINHNTASNILGLNVSYVSKKEELMLQNARELWEYSERLQRAMQLDSENKVLRKVIKDMVAGRL